MQFSLPFAKVFPRQSFPLYSISQTISVVITQVLHKAEDNSDNQDIAHNVETGPESGHLRYLGPILPQV